MLQQAIFGHLSDGRDVRQFQLGNAAGTQVDILDLGGIIRRWQVSTKAQQALDIVLGFDSVDAYLADQAYVGTVVGRYANRIKSGRFPLAGNIYQVDVNQGGNCLHGGHDGFHHRLWQATVVSDADEPSLRLDIVSADGDQGFPGNLQARVTYTLKENSSLHIEYQASSDQDTVFNPTQHSYFNLAGHAAGTLAGHKVQIFSSRFTPTDELSIPTGQFADVSHTPFDFRQATPIVDGFLCQHEQLISGNGYDHNWCLDNYQPNLQQPTLAAIASHETTGLCMHVLTTMPGMQLYSANYLGPQPLGKEGTAYSARGAMCFETQFYPDSPNHAHFPSATLRKGERFRSVTEYQIRAQ